MKNIRPNGTLKIIKIKYKTNNGLIVLKLQY